MKSNLETVFHYHERTKHHPRRYATSLGYLDWDCQPDPFRSYLGCEKLCLPFERENSTVSYESMLTREGVESAKFDLKGIGQFLELSLAISGWKSFGDSKWSLRIDPSSGNLHPTEAHLLLPPGILEPDGAILAHYRPYDHQLEIRTRVPGANLPIGFRKPGRFYMALTSIYWRESWKYGERAFRYCNHDLGHVLACLSFSAALLGWRVQVVGDLSSVDIKKLFRLDEVQWTGHENEEVETLVEIVPADSTPAQVEYDYRLVAAIKAGPLEGHVNKLSSDHHPWSIIEEVSLESEKPSMPLSPQSFLQAPLASRFPAKNAGEVIFKRRSAVDFDGKTALTQKQFFSILDRTLPREGKPPFDLSLGRTRVHLMLFVHRVDELEPGLYFLIRNLEDLKEIQSLSHSEFEWQKVETAPDSLPLYRLLSANLQREAEMISCQQAIAGMSAFSLGMIARFKKELEDQPWVYRHLFWETGIIGQML